MSMLPGRTCSSNETRPNSSLETFSDSAGDATGSLTTPACFSIFWPVIKVIVVPPGGILRATSIAGPLPAEDVARRIPPGGTTITLITGQKIEKQAGVVKLPVASPAESENVSKELFGRVSFDEHVLPGSMLITESRRNGYALDSESRDVVEKTCHFFSGLSLK